MRKPLEDADLVAELRRLRVELEKRSPYAQVQFVDVTFNGTADADTDIRHTLKVEDPYDVRWEVASWSFATAPATAPVVYRDTSATARAWNPRYVVLRCNVASAQARLKLYVER